MRRIGDLVQCDVVAGCGRVALRLVDSRLNDRMREREILAREKFLIRDKIRGAVIVAGYCPLVGAARKSRERDIHIVRRSTHQTDGVLRDELQRAMPRLEILL